MKICFHLGILIGICWILCSCDETFEVYAPPQDIWVVYGVLDAARDTQVIRVSKAFQINDDAIEFAATHDPSVRGLTVSLFGNGITYQAIPKDQVIKDTSSGSFGPSTHIYQIPTPAELALKEGEQYQLTIRSEQEPDLLLQARTSIPPRPKIISPFIRRSLGEKCLPTVPFEDSAIVRFQTNPNRIDAQAGAYEIRVLLAYKEDDISRSHHYGPTRLFSRSRGCTGIDGTLCYELKNGVVIRSLRTGFKNHLASYSYLSEPRCNSQFDPLSHAVEVQVTAIDSFLSTYIRANDPFFLELNNVRPEYTNVEGSERTLGVFGSISYHNIPVGLSPCAEYLIGLREEQPFANCEL
ncbi:MAG: DUF4249 family protein [Bacteroidota bacterium]